MSGALNYPYAREAEPYMNPVQGRDDVYDDFPQQERRHYSNHPSKRDAIAMGMQCVGAEIPQLEHINRDMKDVKSTIVLGQLPPAKIPHSHPHFCSTYQAQCLGIDDIGTVKKNRGKKCVLPPYAQVVRHTGVIGGGGPAAAAYNPQADVGSLTRASGHIPGYSGHVPKNSEHTAAPRATHDKTLVMENFKTNMKGYTGHTK